MGCNRKDNSNINQEDNIPTDMVAPTDTLLPSNEPTPTEVLIPSLDVFTGPLANTMRKEDYPIVDGSTATIPLSEAVYKLATGASDEEAAEAIVHTKTSNSYYRLVNREVDLLIVYEPSEEVVGYMEENGYNLNIKPIGKDALVFMANASNPVESLTHDQLVQIYSGQINSWKDVGGSDMELLAFQRPVNSGSQTLMQKLVMKEKAMAEGPSVQYYAEMGDILEAMADYSNEGNTLGYSVFYYAKNMYQMPELKFMKVNGIEPSLETIYDSSYPYINEFYAVIREDEPKDSNAHKIFDWLTSMEGQSLVKEMGYVPVNMTFEDHTAQYEVITNYTIPDQYNYILSSFTDYNYDEPELATVIIYDGNFKIQRIFSDVSYINQNGLVPENSLIIIESATQTDASYDLKYGLYSLATDEFILPPEYSNMSLLDEEKGYYIVNKDGKNQVVDLSGKVLLSGLDSGDLGGRKEGDRYHLYYINYEPWEETHFLYDQNFKFIKEYVVDYYYDIRLCDSNGELFLSKEIFCDKFGYPNDPEEVFMLDNYQEGNQLFSVIYMDTAMVLDRDLNVLAQRTIDWESYPDYRYIVFEDIFKVDGYDAVQLINVNEFRNNKGNLITDKNGRSYNDISSYYWYTYTGDGNEREVLYTFEDGIMYIYTYYSQRQYKINLMEWQEAEVILVWNDILVIGNKEHENYKTRIYKGYELLYELEGDYRYYYPGKSRMPNLECLILENYEGYYRNYYVIIDKKGKLLYQSTVPEGMIKVDQDLIQTNRGNYTYVVDYQGNVIIKTLKNDLRND